MAERDKDPYSDRKDQPQANDDTGAHGINPWQDNADRQDAEGERNDSVEGRDRAPSNRGRGRGPWLGGG